MTKTVKSSLWADIDFDKDGKQTGRIVQSYPTNRSAYGNLYTPIGIIKNGEGPTLLLTAGVHGDEYEGQVALRTLFQKTNPADIKGRLLILPSVHMQATIAGTRLSPLDGQNLHASFTNDAQASFPSQKLAHYIESNLLSISDCLIDLHSGGTSLNYMPFCSIRISGNEAIDSKALDLLRAFNAPLSTVWKEWNQVRMSSAAERQGVVALSGEFGGNAALSSKSVKIVERGIRNVIGALGMTSKKWSPGTLNTKFVEVNGRDYYINASHPGIFEHAVKLGQKVEKGQPAGQMHPIETIDKPPTIYTFPRDGFVICQRGLALANTGDCLTHLATIRPK